MQRNFVLAAAIALAGLSACGPTPRAASGRTAAATAVDPKEECLESYVNCYRDRDKDRLNDLLAPDYYFHSAGWENVLPRETDIWTTGGLFDVCAILGLEIRKGEWTRVDEVRGKPCENCWETTRGYIFVWSPGVGTATASVGHMRFIVRGTHARGTRTRGAMSYRIRAIEELEGSESQQLVAPE